MTRRVALALLGLLALLQALPAAAMTYQRMADGDLADQAALIAVVRVTGSAPAALRNFPFTDYRLEVASLLKGQLPAASIVARVAGGVGADGIGLRLSGAPSFTAGERAILFLVPNDDGTYGILHLGLGAFHERETLDGRKVAARDLREAHAVGNSEPELYRELDSFSRWLTDRGLGIHRPSDYFLPEGTAVARGGFEKFDFLIDASGAADRWFHFDQGRDVTWYVFEGGQPGLGLDESIAAFQIAMRAWVDDARTEIRYVYGGTTGADAGFDFYDGVNAVLFDDPHRNGANAVPGSFSCPAGGVIAVGAPWFYTVTQPYRAYVIHETVEADIVTNDGTQCLFQGNRTVAEEVLTHELGHTLGLAHTLDPDAIMWASVHNDGRGADLKPDDRAAVAEFYSVSGKPPAKVPNPPAKLTLRATADTRVALKWLDKSSNELGFQVEVKIGADGAFREVGSVLANVKTVSEDGLVLGETYSFRLRAYNRKGFSRYSNVVTITTPD